MHRLCAGNSFWPLLVSTTNQPSNAKRRISDSFALQVISFWAPSFSTQRALWFSSVANTNLWFTFAKAIYSVLKGKFLNRCGAAGLRV